MGGLILIRGGGDLASGAALRLRRAGMVVLISELEQPLVVRRRVSFAEAVYAGETSVEGITARRVEGVKGAWKALAAGEIPVLVDPTAGLSLELKPLALVDGRMIKRPPEIGREAAELVIGLGPGFIGGVNCHAVIETQRGHYLGRVIWDGTAEADTGVPESLNDKSTDNTGERVLRAPAEGILQTNAEIGDHLEPGQKLAEVAGQPVIAPFRGVLRGLAHPGLFVKEGTKIADIDPRDDPAYCFLVSDKSLAVGGGVLEALLYKPAMRRRLWEAG